MASHQRPNPQGTSITDLPEELLLQVFTHLTQLGPNYEAAEDPWFIQRLPFRNAERDDHPHPGLRAYPFLGQVCKKWDQLLRTPIAKTMLWKQLVVDFGHELVTAIHTPLKWSNRRPTADEFSAALSATTLSVNKVIEFMMQRKDILKKLYLCNSEGFWGDESEYIQLTNKHNFQASHLGFCLGFMCNTLQELCLYNCSDLFSSDLGMWTLVSSCHQLRVFAVEGINCRVPAAGATQLSKLKKLETLTLVGETQMGQWIIGLDAIPSAWSQLTSLTRLELRGHQLLDTVPTWLSGLSSLEHLDVSANQNIDISNVVLLKQLKVLSLQHLEFCQLPVGGAPVSQQAKRVLPDLTPLAGNLTALSLASNCMTRIPAFMAKLTALQVLDVSENPELVVPTPISSALSPLPHLAILDFRGIHREKSDYWSAEKCTTMKHVGDLVKMLKRRKYTTHVMLDTQ